jgi:hypothetical protein
VRHHFGPYRLATSHALLVLALLALVRTVVAQGEAPYTLAVDWPTEGALVGPHVVLSGWAVSPRGGAGAGIDAVQVYLDGPAGSGQLLGRADYGLPRPDIAELRGDERFAASGWRLEARLPPGPRSLFIYARLADEAGAGPWVGPVQIGVTVESGSPMAAAAPEPTTVAASPTPCGPGGPGTARCPPSPTPAPGECIQTDRDSGRCLARVPAAPRGATPPGAGAVPGSWVAAVPATPAALATPEAAAPTRPPYAAWQPMTRPGSPETLPLSLTAALTTGRYVQLTWNQPPSNGDLAYEVRRCPALSSATLTCEVVAVVRAGAYRMYRTDGIYVIRAVGPDGQPQGESNRVRICCGG